MLFVWAVLFVGWVHELDRLCCRTPSPICSLAYPGAYAGIIGDYGKGPDSMNAGFPEYFAVRFSALAELAEQGDAPPPADQTQVVVTPLKGVERVLEFGAPVKAVFQYALKQQILLLTPIYWISSRLFSSLQHESASLRLRKTRACSQLLLYRASRSSQEHRLKAICTIQKARTLGGAAFLLKRTAKSARDLASSFNLQRL